MKADSELIEYMEKRYRNVLIQEDRYSDNHEEGFKRAYYVGEASVFREILMIVKGDDYTHNDYT